MIRALFFDFGGVLVRTATDAPRRALERELGLAPYSLEDRVFNREASLRGQRGELGEDEAWRQIAIDLQLDGRMDVNEFRQRFFSGDFIDEDWVALIRGLRPAIKTGLISNAWDNLRRLLIEDFRIADAFDTLVISAEEGVMKPDPRIYHTALRRLGVTAGESIFVDDVLDNVRGAEAVGMRGVHFRSPEQARREIEQLLRNA
jgi:putative hydrolase of the HAD superfamily